ncbi:P-loop containing nucleoside triphosphate hydrolase protein [Aspergillus pseudotamarii]|uniref:P-loop containing nucleoside triphosphate hydrolase protein n=1 Tax=Aspergillus pseudotamarii TaxID=132259 RepID=A0A5N6T731_ASPPS|nr:P-loop containing nucleoside triphosphate hydrolase protein [Aspergillus pseudotamarii]KAE8142021.1 P-loop containing nucleoside triphosphate hydrolase protein [Aspergillus pseudotamarii]
MHSESESGYESQVSMDEPFTPMFKKEPHHDGQLPDITPDDRVIAVMGITGVGKSTFISHFNEDALVGDSLMSCTTEVGIHKAQIDNQRIFLIDTPGFDDTTRSDTDVLVEIADWLRFSYNENIKLAGIIYLHRIKDVRMGGASIRNLMMFKKLCGEKCLNGVVLATTMWNNPPTEKEVKRESQLKSERKFWGEMIGHGSQVFRQDDGITSATEIIRYILSRPQNVTLRIQEEMASGKSLGETAAGKEVQAEVERLRARYERQLNELRKEMKEAERRQDLNHKKEIEAVRAELEEELKSSKQQQSILRMDIDELQRERDAMHQQDMAHREAIDELRRQRDAEREEMYEKEMAHKEALHQRDADLRVLRARDEYESRLLELETQMAREKNRRGGCVMM